MTLSSPTIVDCRGMSCPAPILETARAARKAKGSRNTLQVLADDAAFPMDIQSWCRSSGARLVGLDLDEAGVHTATITLAAPAPSATPPSSPSPSPGPKASPSQPQPAEASGVTRVDYRGMQCPSPILNLAKAARRITDGSSIEILADDPAFEMDLKSWCRSAGHKLVSIAQQGDYTRAIVRREAASPSVGALPAATSTAATHSTSSPPARGAVSLDNLGDAEIRNRLEELASNRTSFVVEAASPAFLGELMRWTGEHKHELVTLDTRAQRPWAEIAVGQGAPQQAAQPSASMSNSPKKATYLVLHNDMELLLAALMCANAAAAQNMETTIFFSFWGLNLLRGDVMRDLGIDLSALERTSGSTALVKPKSEKATLPQWMFKKMMPRGPRNQSLGQLNFGGMGRFLLNRIMKSKNIMTLQDNMVEAIESDVKFIVCTMSLSVMGMQMDDIMDLPNIRYGGVASFVEEAVASDLSLMF